MTDTSAFSLKSKKTDVPATDIRILKERDNIPENTTFVKHTGHNSHIPLSRLGILRQSSKTRGTESDIFHSLTHPKNPASPSIPGESDEGAFVNDIRSRDEEMEGDKI